MTSVYQLSGILQSDNTSTSTPSNQDVLIYGNPSAYTQNVIPSGSKCINSEISLKGLSTNQTNASVVKIQFPTGTLGSNWNFDLNVRAFSDNNISSSNWIVMKSASDIANWSVIVGQGFYTDQTHLLVPSIVVDNTARVITIQQNPSSVDDGFVYYVIKFSFSSGNNPNVAIPVFFL